MSRSLRIGLVQFFILAFACLFLPAGSAVQFLLILISVLFSGWVWYELDYPDQHSNDGFWLPWVAFLVIGILSVNRFSTLPVSSDEFKRYFWDAVVSAHQLNPFLLSPGQVISKIPALAAVSDQTGISSGLSFHPPLAQGFFSFSFRYPAVTFSPDLFVYRLEILLTSLFVISSWLLLVLNREKPDFSRWTVAFILSPVFLFQGILEVHAGLLAVPWIILGALLLKKNWFFASGAVFAAASGFDLMVLILIPFLFSSRIEKRSWLFLFFGFLLVSVLMVVFIVFPMVSPDHLTILQQVRFHEFNSFFPAVWIKLSGWVGIQVSDLFSLLMFFFVFLFFLTGLLFYSFRQKSWEIRLRFGLFGLLLFLVFSPEVHPWMMIIPFSLVFMLRIVPLSLCAWFIFSMFTILINQHPYSPDSYWQFRVWEYGVVLPLLIADGYRFLWPYIFHGKVEPGEEVMNPEEKVVVTQEN